MRYSDNVREGCYFLCCIVTESLIHCTGPGQLVSDVGVVGVVRVRKEVESSHPLFPE